MRLERNPSKYGYMISGMASDRRMRHLTSGFNKAQGKRFAMRHRVHNRHRNLWARMWMQIDLFGKDRGAQNV